MKLDLGFIANHAMHRIGWSGNRERSPEPQIPYFDHIADNVIILKDGSVMAMARLEGLPFHLSSNAARNGNRRRHFAMLQLLADGRTEVVEHLVCHSNVAPFACAPGGSDYWREFLARYETRALRGLRQLDWVVTVIVHPRPFKGNVVEKVRRKLGFGAGEEIPSVDPQSLRFLKSKMRTLFAACRKQNPVRLGVRDEDGILFSEMGEALELIRTTRKAKVPLSQPAGSFASMLYRDRVVFGQSGEGFLIERAGGRSMATVGRMFGMSVYPKHPRVGMFDALMMDKEELHGARWVMTNAIRTLNRAKANDNLDLILKRMEANDSRASSDIADIERAMDELTGSQEVRGQHGTSWAVHADNMEQLDEISSAVSDIIAGAGCKPSPAGIDNEAIYWMQLPGNRHLCPQPATIGLNRFTELSPLEAHPVGAAGPAKTIKPRWGAAIMRYATAGGSVYDHEIFDGRIGHTLWCGPSDGGKSVCVGANITAATALIGDRGTILVFDKDRSQKLTVENNGGTYTELKHGEDSGAAPLQRLKNNSRDRSALVNLIIGMILADGGPPVSERAKNRIAQGVAFVMRQPPERRQIGTVHAWVPPYRVGDVVIDPSDAANRLRPWCRGERLGWAFDGERDTLNFDRRMAGVDYTQLLSDAAVLPVMAAYLFVLANKVMDNRRFIFVVEELKFLLPKPEFTRGFEDALLTGRKKNIAFWPIIQQPEHLLEHPLGPALLGQCRTRFLFKNELASQHAYCGGGQWGDGLHATLQEYNQVREGMAAGAWSVLMQRPAGKSVLCRFDLKDMPEDLLILSGTPKSCDLWDSISARRAQFIERLEEVEA